MKRRVTRILALFMALILMSSMEVPHVLANEYTVEEDSTTSDVGTDFLQEDEGDFVLTDTKNNFSDKKGMNIYEKLEDKEFSVEIKGDELSLYDGNTIQAINADNEVGQESIIHFGSVSGYLSDMGDYALYTVNLSAGDYLQARLSVPSNPEINYALVLYDSSLNIVKVSDYITYLNGSKSLEESIGYLCIEDEVMYIGAFSCYGGSETEGYTLDFSITTNFSNLSDSNEPNENTQEAFALDLGKSGASASGMINSAIDNEWYSFNVLDTPDYNKIRLQITSTSNVNGCMIEVYRDVLEGDSAMQLVASGTEGEIGLPAGEYFLRVVSTNTFDDFNAGDIPTYNLSVVPVSKVDHIEVTTYSGYHGTAEVEYPQGKYYRIDDQTPNSITIVGWAYYTDGVGNKHAAANVRVNGSVLNNQLESRYPDFCTTYGSAVTGSDGFFRMTVSLYPAIGGLSYDHIISTHYYDYMSVRVWNAYNSNVYTTSHFYLLKMSIPW